MFITLKAPSQKIVVGIQWIFVLLFVFYLFFFDINPWIIFVGWFLGWFGGIIIPHRWYSHNYFVINKNYIKILFHTIYNLTLIGSIISYKYQHALHHKFNDDVNADPHTPFRTGFWNTTFGLYDNVWKHDRKLWIRLLRECKISKWFHENYFLIPILLIITLGLIDIELLLFYTASVTISWQLIQLKIATLHWKVWGAYKNYDCGGYNIWWLKPILMGDEMHNNHHYSSKPNKNYKNNWKEFDPSFYVCKFLNKIC